MTTYWNTKFTKRNPECTTIVAIKANKLPKDYSADVWKPNGIEVKEGIELKRIDIIHQNGERIERFGYL